MTTPTDKAQKLAEEYAKKTGLQLAQSWSLPNTERFIETIRVIKLDFLSGFRSRDEEVAELKRKLRIALGHGNCYCKECKSLSEKYWHPVESPKALSALDPKAGDDTLNG